MGFTNMLASVSAGFREHIPEVLTGIGIGGFITSIVLAVKATQKSEQQIYEKEHVLGRPMTKKEVVADTWTNYIPTALCATASTASIICGAAEYKKRNAAIAALCTLAETTLADYKEEAKKLIGEEKEKEISDKIDEKTAQRIEDSGQKPLYSKRCDNYLTVSPWYDLYAGRPCYVSEDDLQQARNRCNERLNYGERVIVNDFYDELGLDHAQVGDDYWDLNEQTGLIEFKSFGSHRSGGIAYSTFAFANPPKRAKKLW